MIQNGHGDVDNMVKCLKDEMWDSAKVLRRKKISVAGAVYLVNTVLLPRALYRLKLWSAFDEQIDQIQSVLRKTIASKAHHITAANSSILFGGYMGCEWKRWKYEVGIERLKIIEAAWQERPLCLQKVCVVQCGVHNRKVLII